MARKINLTDELKKCFGFNKFKGNQEAIINNLLDGKDTFVLMPTGGGKSLCYQLPSLLMEGTAIVISPLIALMKNQVDAMRNFSEEDGVAHFINSSLNKGAIDQVRSDILAGKTKLLYVAPESLTKEENVEFLRSVKISFYAVDEAHCISEWGHDFRPEYRRIRPIINEIGKAPLIALTATATPKVQHDIQKNLGMVDAQVFKSSFNRPNLYYEVRAKTANIDRDIIKFIKNNPEKSGIIYCLSRKKVEELAEILQANGINARPYHAGMDSLARTKNQDDFLMEKVDVIVATIAFGMGIDKSNVRWVIHYNLPKSIESFYQEIGRAGRDGLPSDTVLFYSLGDLILLTKFATESNQQTINLEKLQRMHQYAEADICRRRILLSYFGETSTEDCGNCDVCKNPPQRFDGTVIVQKALSAIARAEQQISTGILIDILRGSYSAEVTAKGYQELKTFGAGRDIPPRDWQDYLLQMLQLGYFEIAYNENNHLKITPSGSNILFGKAKAMLAVIHREEIVTGKGKKKKVVIAKELPFGIPGGENEDLFEALRGLRKQIADQDGLPAYIILSDKVLHLLSISRPTTIEAFGEISGIGEFKKKKYGKEFVNLIKQFV